MREYFLSAVRHLSGAVAGAVAGFLVTRGLAVLSPEQVAVFADGLHALILGVSLAAYAAVEKLLKPVLTRLFGSAGV